MTIGFWIAAGALALLALGFLLVPLWRGRPEGGKPGLSGLITAVAIAPVSVALYFLVSTFDADVEPLITPEQLAALEGLAARLGENPDDVEGWFLLGRAYRALGNYSLARQAFEQAWVRTERPDDALKLSYAEAMIFTDPTLAMTVGGDLIEEVLAGSPNNQAALWLGSIVAIERNQRTLAADRMRALLATNPPPEIAELIRSQLAGLGMSAGPPPAADGEPGGPVIEVEVSVADDIDLGAFGAEARLYVLARGPDSPAPVAVLQAGLDALPGSFSLSDRDNPMAALGAGRSLGDFDSVTVTARISASGIANAQPGDAYAEAMVAPGSGETLRLVIDRVVPDG